MALVLPSCFFQKMHVLSMQLLSRATSPSTYLHLPDNIASFMSFQDPDNEKCSAGRVLWLMTPELADFASSGTADQSGHTRDPPKHSEGLQPASSLIPLDPTLSQLPSPPLGMMSSPSGSLKGSKSAPSLSHQAGGSHPCSEASGAPAQPAADAPAQDATTSHPIIVQGSHGLEKQRVLMQRAPQRVSSWSQFDGMGGFWSRLPWPRLASFSANGDYTADAAVPISQSLPVTGSQDAASNASSPLHQLQPSTSLAHAVSSDHVTGANSGGMSAARSLQDQPSSAHASESRPAPEGEDTRSWSAPFSGYTHWPLPDDISTGFPHWANVLLGYPPTHDSLMAEEDTKEAGSETKHDAGAKNRRLLMLDADRTCWTRMKLSVDMINDHLPDTYLEVTQLL